MCVIILDKGRMHAFLLDFSGVFNPRRLFFFLAVLRNHHRYLTWIWSAAGRGINRSWFELQCQFDCGHVNTCIVGTSSRPDWSVRYNILSREHFMQISINCSIIAFFVKLRRMKTRYGHPIPFVLCKPWCDRDTTALSDVVSLYVPYCMKYLFAYLFSKCIQMCVACEKGYVVSFSIQVTIVHVYNTQTPSSYDRLKKLAPLT